MFVDSTPLMMAFYGNLLGWAMTAAGAALIFPLEYLNLPKARLQLVLDASLGALVTNRVGSRVRPVPADDEHRVDSVVDD